MMSSCSTRSTANHHHDSRKVPLIFLLLTLLVWRVRIDAFTDVVRRKRGYYHHQAISRNIKVTSARATSISSDNNNNDGVTAVQQQQKLWKDISSRKRFIQQVGGSLALLPSVGLVVMAQAPSTVAAAAEGVLPFSASQDHPVAVIGGGGRTGMEVAQELGRNQIPAITLTRTGRDPFQVIKLPAEIKKYIRHYEDPANVINDSLDKALSSIQPSAIVYVASASKQGGTAVEVDQEGVGRAAKLAKSIRAVQKFVLVSALAVDRPESKSFKITNSLGGNLDGIMDAKRHGEELVRAAQLPSYVIVRPGPLMNGKSKAGAADIELNQGDMIGGGLSRDELAGIVVGALLAPITDGVTVEAYRTSTHTSLQPDFPKSSGNELHGDTYASLFANAKKDS